MKNKDDDEKIEDEGEEESIEDEEYIVYSLDDKEMESLGKTLKIKYSREFLKITQKKRLNLKEIAKIITKTDNPRLANTIHHQKRMEKIGLIARKFKLQRKKGHTLKFYKGKKIIIIVPEELVDAVQNNEELKTTLRKILKFGAIGVAALVSHGLLITNVSESSSRIMAIENVSIIIPLIILITGLIIERSTPFLKKLMFDVH